MNINLFCIISEASSSSSSSSSATPTTWMSSSSCVAEVSDLTCSVCLEQVNSGEFVRSLPCLHQVMESARFGFVSNLSTLRVFMKCRFLFGGEVSCGVYRSLAETAGDVSGVQVFRRLVVAWRRREWPYGAASLSHGLRERYRAERDS